MYLIFDFNCEKIFKSVQYMTNNFSKFAIAGALPGPHRIRFLYKITDPSTFLTKNNKFKLTPRILMHLIFDFNCEKIFKSLQYLTINFSVFAIAGALHGPSRIRILYKITDPSTFLNKKNNFKVTPRILMHLIFDFN